MTSGDVIRPGVLIGGRDRRRTVLVDYDHAWPARFATERARVDDALGSRARRVDHVGSTSVPGLASQPVVDVLVQVRDPEDEFAYVPPLLRAGYEMRVRQEGHRMLRTPERDVHVHVCGAGSAEAYRFLVFRDWLRLDATDRRAYEALKRELAADDRMDAETRLRAKGAFVTEAIARAEAWALATY
jgi:GrpB-like predicted nucleotidyltransferase (UPF0157 family)